ncbi:hypothetical protein PENTCL1PPCAC_21539, partial [Pristionchus entomophagus]
FEFHEACRSSSAESTELVFFTVFSLPALALLVCSHATGTFLQFLISSLRAATCELEVSRSIISEIAHAGSQFCLLWGLTLTVYYHAAGFRGNTVMRSSGTQTSFADVVAGFHSGSRLLIATSPTKLSYTELDVLVGNRTNEIGVVQPDQQKMFQQQDKRLVTVIESNAVHAMSLVQRPCQLSKITVPPTWLGLERFYSKVVQNYQFSRNYTTRGSVEAVNQVLLRLFQQDYIEGFWTKRFLSTVRDVPAIDPDPPRPKETYQPLSLSHLQLVFYCTFPGWVLSVLVFFFEINPLHSLVAPLMRFVHSPGLFDRHK